MMLMLNCLVACSTFEYHETVNVPANRVDEVEESRIDEETLLDVGIVLFDSGVDIMDDESAAYANVRESEAVWFSSLLKQTLEYSNAWGIVRTLPNSNSMMDLTIEGEILESNGEILKMQISAIDATGRTWLSNEYFERASAYSYNPEVDLKRDPFQNLFTQVANDLFDFRASLTAAQLINTRDVAKIRFAQGFAPQSFDGFIVQDEQGRYQLQRVPAETDPMILRVDQIRARNDLFLDVVQDYYRGFNKNMSTPYDEWRKLSYKEVIYERQLRKQAKQEKIAGVAIMVAGVLASGSSSRSTSIGGHVGILTGADIFRKGFETEIESSIHASSLHELGKSLEAELEPSVIDLQDRSVTLTGTVEDQFKEWRRILQQMFEAEQSLELDDTSQSKAPEVDERDAAGSISINLAGSELVTDDGS